MQKKQRRQAPVQAAAEFMTQRFIPQPETKIDKNHVLLHSCCGLAVQPVSKRLLPDYRITIFL